MAKRRNSLGRGLDSLIGGDIIEDISSYGASSISEVAISEISPNTQQPRSIFNEEALSELAQSIKSVGIIQPITLCLQTDGETKYRIISGERRYRASVLAGLKSIPAYIRTAEDEQIMEMALIENIQREDLNAIEISLAFKKLLDEHGLTQEELSERVGKKRSTISNYIRLLRLPSEIQIALKENKLTMGHARALLSLENSQEQLQVFHRILTEQLSVRDLEKICKQKNNVPSEEKSVREKPSSIKSQELELLKKQFSKLFDTNVDLKINKKGQGKITIPFSSEEKLERILILMDKLNVQ